jgi:hypothetical protein
VSLSPQYEPFPKLQDPEYHQAAGYYLEVQFQLNVYIFHHSYMGYDGVISISQLVLSSRGLLLVVSFFWKN